jgi:PAS domain S-box-containing protein
METQFNPFLVSLSFLVAIFASYVALNLANSVARTVGWMRAVWLAAGAVAMGIGIWSMHFVGMLAFEMPGMVMAYDVPLMILSVVVAILASWLALYIVSRDRTKRGAVVAGGVAMAVAIAGMHYIGMHSMRMEARIVWNYYLVAMSVVVALVASFGALTMLSRLRDKTEHLWPLFGASTIMGFAIAGMHYTGMLAATFIHDPTSGIHSSNLVVSDALTLAVLTTTLSILVPALAFSIWRRQSETRTKSAAIVLGRSEEKFRHLVEAVKDYAIMMLDTEGRLTTWNSGAKRISGYSDDEVLGKHFSIFYTEEDIRNNTAEYELRTATQMGHFEGEGRRLRKDGSMYWANIVITPLINSEGFVTGFSKVVRDITAVKEADRRLRQMNEELEERVRSRTLELEMREHQLRTITNAVPILIAQCGADERMQFANEAFSKWFHGHTDKAIGSTLREIVGEDRYAEVEPVLKRVLAGETVSYERISTDTGAVLYVTFMPELSSGGVVKSFLIVASDITRQKEIQAELEKAKEAAEVANSAKSAFLANMSHEIRTPLGAILGFSELLINEKMSAAERADSVEVIKRNGRLLSNVINDILDLSKVEAGKLEIERITVPFDDVMKDLSSVLSLEADKKGISLSVVADGFVPNTIKTDPLRLRQVLINIVGNAIKFTERGSVEVRIKMMNTDDAPPKLAFLVKDTGEGIEAGQVQRLFMPFQQADASITRKFGGTGLGLVLSRKLAAALGGDVRLIESMPGKGSTFLITIDPGVSEEVYHRNSAAVSPVPSSANSRLNKLNILVVDDSPDNQALIKAILKHRGASVETASNGREAVDMAMTEKFDVILMDLQMPVMDGYEATRVLRERGYKKPIIALTAHAMREERDRTLSSGFDDHITKPIDQRALVKTLAEISN